MGLVVLLFLACFNLHLPRQAIAQTGQTDCNPPSFCRWYVSKNRFALSKGVRASISTITQAPPLLSNNGYRQFHSVTTSATGSQTWVQSGWLYFDGDSSPRPYVETWLNGQLQQFPHGSVGWNTTQLYEVYSPNGDTSWCGYIASVKWECGLTASGVTNQVIWQSEVHLSHAMEIEAQYSNAQYKDASTNLWTTLTAVGFNKTELPYRGESDFGNSWIVKRGSTVSMALAANP
jgi:hypothetical protein